MNLYRVVANLENGKQVSKEVRAKNEEEAKKKIMGFLDTAAKIITITAGIISIGTFIDKHTRK